MKTIIVISTLLILASPAFAGNKELDRKQIYELKEKCSQSAERYFEQETAAFSKYFTFLETSQSYNSRLNTCLVEESRKYPDNRIVTIVTDIMKNTIVASCTTEVNGVNVVEGEFFKSRDDCIRRLWQLMNE